MLISNKKFFRIIMLIFLILAFYSANVKAIVKPTSEFYVNDYANVLSKETKEYIINTNIDLNNKTKAQVVVVTVESLEGKTIEEYATELFRSFGIGDKNLNNGVLLLCSTGDRMFRIEVGYGLEGALPDGKTGRIQDTYIIPYLKNNDYDQGIKNGFSSVLEEVSKEYEINVDGIQEVQAVDNSSDDSLKLFAGGTILSILISRIIKRNSDSKDKEKGLIIKTIYLIILSLISYALFQSVFLTLLLVIINLITLAIGVSSGNFYSGGGYSGGGYSGGGFSSGGRWRILWRRRFFRRRRLFKRILKIFKILFRYMLQS